MFLNYTAVQRGVQEAAKSVIIYLVDKIVHCCFQQ